MKDKNYLGWCIALLEDDLKQKKQLFLSPYVSIKLKYSIAMQPLVFATLSLLGVGLLLPQPLRGATTIDSLAETSLEENKLELSLPQNLPLLATETRERDYLAENTNDLLQQGKQLYDRGKLAAAAKIWEIAKTNYSNAGQIAELIRCNNYLAKVYQDLGNSDLVPLAIAENSDLITRVQSQITRRNSNTQNDNFALLKAQTLNTQGSWQLKQGKGETAFTTWQQTEAIYRSLDDVTGIIIARINQAQALQSMGFYRRSQKKLQAVRQQLDSLPDSELKIATLHSLGTNLALSGDTTQAKQALTESLSVAKKLNSPSYSAETYLRLGNLARTQKNHTEALNYYQRAIDFNPHPEALLKTRLNQFSLLIDTQQTTTAEKLIVPIRQQLDRFTLSRSSIYARVNFAQSLLKLDDPEVEPLLIATIERASQLEDSLAHAHAMGTLGNWYEKQNRYDEALQLTNNALNLLVNHPKTTIAATLHWQQGRILNLKGNKQSAISAYREAVTDLEHLQQDLVSVNPDIQFSFQQQVEPVYRELVALLLQDIDSLDAEQKQQRLELSLSAIEALKQKELENFFRIACLDVTKHDIAQIDPKAAVIYPILLPNSIETIISIPGKPLTHYRTAIDASQQTTTFNSFLQYLNPVFGSQAILPPSQQLYDWLIRPAEALLAAGKIETLVFVLDGKLRSLPMSALHDGNQYLIEKYDLALTPGLQLLKTNNLAKDRGETLTGGITESRQGFAALPGVKAEIENIRDAHSAKILIDGDFTHSNIERQVSDRPIAILHLATHGQFSSKAEDTFILTWENRINVTDFDRLLNQRESGTPIDLLVLSACQTAAGDEQAILGLAGMAIRSGATSTVATLWSVSDRSTASLMSQFYSYLNQKNVNKAEAIRQAQLSLLNNNKYQHPYYWSAFVLVGNWQ